MESRDFWAWAVDIATVVGAAAVIALVVSFLAFRSEQKRHENILESERHRVEEAWQRQVALDHHARIHEAAATLITAITGFTRRAEARVLARRMAVIDHGYGPDADETSDPGYAALLDRLGGPLATVLSAIDTADTARYRLYFLIPRGESGDQLLNDLILVDEALRAVRPTVGHDAGIGDLDSVLDQSGLRQPVAGLVDTEFLGAENAMARLAFVRGLATNYFLGRIGMFVEPPPLVDLD